MAQGLADALGRALGRALAAGAKAAVRSLTRSPSRRTPTTPVPRRTPDGSEPRTTPRTTAPGPAPDDTGYPGDFTGRVDVEYRPETDGDADPGEVVWGWVPYEEDHARGKDRPVLVVGRDGGWLLGLPLTSKDHDRDAAQEARAGREWMDVGTGAWDARGRPSEVRLDRVVRLDPGSVRREGGRLDRHLFDAVTERAAQVNGW